MLAIWRPDCQRIWPTPFLSLLECEERQHEKFSDQAIQVWSKPVPTIQSKFYQSTIFQLGSKFFMCPFFCQVWAFSESEWFSLNMESWHRKFSIFFLNCDTRLSVMSWSHLLLMRSICCASDAVGHTGVLNLLRSDNLSHRHLFGYCW